MEFIPGGYFLSSCSEVFVASDWIKELIETQAIPKEFITHSNYGKDDIQSFLLEGKVQKCDRDKWEILTIERHERRSDSLVCQLPVIGPLKAENGKPCFVEILQYVSQANFSNSWREAFKTFSHNLIEDRSKTFTINTAHYGSTVPHDSALLEVICRLYNCPVIDATNEMEAFAPDEDAKQLRNVCPVIACIITEQEFVIIRRKNRYTLHHMLRYSPYTVDNSFVKPLFLVYQLLMAFNDVHARGLTIGDLGLHDILVDEELYVSIIPKPKANLLIIKDEMDEILITKEAAAHYPAFQSLVRSLQTQLENADSDVESAEEICDNFLGTAVSLWTTGRLSNFDYILLLNYLSGRNFSNPNHYPVMPWVRDFSSRRGGWRDLTKSKYRLNKGDTQLDLTYESNKNPNQQHEAVMDPLSQQKAIVHVPHHVSDVLSEITYYVYKARRTSKSVLCRYVRNRWVPAEYPSSMQRLMEWTPDECIPDFFMDPNLFTSMHDDLADLELPSWCSSPEEFVQWHRECLESPRVAEKLHSWIDLTFGYKLSGSSAVRAKNVCLNLVDNHVDLRDGGVVQLFNSPHPIKMSCNVYWDKKKAPNLEAYLRNGLASEDSDSEAEDNVSRLSLNDEPTLNSKPISLPQTYEALSLLIDTEQLSNFIAKNNTVIGRNEEENTADREEKKKTPLVKALQTRRLVRDMQVMGCLIVELFLPRKFLALGGNVDLNSRFDLAIHILDNEFSTIPHCIRTTVQALLRPKKNASFAISDMDRYPTVSDQDGLPPPSAFQLLVPMMSSLSFPPCFEAFSRILRVHQDIEESTAEAKRYTDRWTSDTEEKVAEIKVKTLASELLPIIDDLDREDTTIILPKLKILFRDPGTAIMMSWLTFEPLARILGPKKAIEQLLQPIVNIYENNAQTSKHLKLYHRTFLCNVMVRFSLRIFLKYFTENLIEAVGGYKDFADNREGLERDWTAHNDGNVEKEEPAATAPATAPATAAAIKNSPKKSGCKTPNEEHFAEGEVFAFDNEEEPAQKASNVASSKETKADINVPSAYDVTAETLLAALSNCDKIGKLSEGNISQVASESVIWLAHRLGPVLTAKYLSKNLLKMLNLCYVGQKSTLILNDVTQNDFIIRILSNYKTQGDSMAHNVLECLTELASIYGENFVLLQYLPYAWDLISLCKRKLNPNLEGGLIGCVIYSNVRGGGKLRSNFRNFSDGAGVSL
jgi:WD repeat-containing protein 81